MKNLITAIAFITALFLIISCSTFNKLKEKLSSKKEKEDTEQTVNNETVKEEKKETTSIDDIVFYNKYIEVSNKIQEAGDKVYKDYLEHIPSSKSVNKNSFIMAVFFANSVDNLERTIKEFKRSYFDGGELSKLNASSGMKGEIESGLKDLFSVLDEYYNTANKVSDYYSKGEYKKDISNAVPYDEEMKSIHEKYKSAFDKFAGAIKKHKPKREKRDPESISNPDEKAAAILLNSYENTIEAAEVFYEGFNGLEYKSDLTGPGKAFENFRKVFIEEKNMVLGAEFTDKTKYMKYSYEDYFVKMTNGFLDAGSKFFDDAPSAKNVNEFNRLYDNVVNNYNYMITAYNTNINIVNTFRVY